MVGLEGIPTDTLSANYDSLVGWKEWSRSAILQDLIVYMINGQL